VSLRYCFDLFSKGGQTGLKGQSMAVACSDILINKGMTVATVQYNTGQDWYDTIKDKFPSLSLN